MLDVPCSMLIRSIIGLLIAAYALSMPLHASASADHTPLKPFKADPDQVLVLYNADWTIDVDGSQPGQDSKEVADYYVKMHTDPAIGKKPYVLGLRCKHPKKKHLNQWFIAEASQDNKDGIEFVGQGRGPRDGEWVRDSRKVEIVINPDKKEVIDWDSFTFWVKPADGKKMKVVDPMVSGIPKKKGHRFVYPAVEQGKGRCYRFDAHQYATGTINVLAAVKGTSGKTIKNLKLIYYDRDDFKPSIFGADGIIDEKHFQEDVAIPVKTFLEDPKNALADGTSLKEHILYILICHGLPFSCEGVFGIERGATSAPHNHGDIGSLEQRLQTLYYGWEKAPPPVITYFMNGGPDSKEGVRNYRITSSMRRSLIGRRANPYMHPDTYNYLGGKKEVVFHKLPDFQTVRKKINNTYFAYGVSRIDGPGPEAAKRQIDFALYASKYLTPRMTDAFGQPASDPDSNKLTMSQKLRKAEQENLWGNEELDVLGFKFDENLRARFLGRIKAVPPKGVLKTQPSLAGGYLPGAIDFTVISHNGWNIGRHAHIWQQVDRGVTVSACGGPAYGGGPHITNATFLDTRILFRYLFRGRDLGECFLLSTIYVNWSTSLLGDPLYHPDLSMTVADNHPPRVESMKDIDLKLLPSLDHYCGRLQVRLNHSEANPEVALIEVEVTDVGDTKTTTSRWPIFSARPYVYLRDLKPNTEYVCRIILTDPYGNRSDLADQLGPFHFKTPASSDETPKIVAAYQREKGWRVSLKRRKYFNEKGTIEIDFLAGKNGMLPAVKSGKFNLTPSVRGDKLNLSMTICGPKMTWGQTQPLKEGEEARLVLRWRRFPLTREVLLKAKNGTEFCLIADVRTPYETIGLDWTIELSEPNGVVITGARAMSDAQPASPVACLADVPQIDGNRWREANQ